MSVRKNFFKDVFYSGIAKYSSIVITLLVTSVLARILEPSDFGLVALATVFITFFNLISDFGIATAIVQFKDLSDKDLSSIFGWTFWLAILLGGSFYLLTPLIASFYNNSCLISICKLLSLQVLFATLNIVPNALLLKHKLFSIVAIRTFWVQLICGFIAIASALNGLGLYSLLISPVLGIFLNFLVNEYYMKIPIVLFPSLLSLKKIFSFSIFQFLFNFVNYIGNNLDKMIIGKSFSMSGLGFYEKAYRLEQMPAQTIIGVIAPVLHPYLSDYQNDKCKILNIYNKSNYFLLSISFPISAFCLICARELVLIIFGTQWEESISYFAIISFSVATQLATVHTSAVLQSCNKTKLLFMMGFANVIIALTSVLIGAFVFKSIISICICGVCSAILCAILTYEVTYRFCFNISPKHIFKYSIKPIACYFVIGIVGHIISDYIVYFPLFFSIFIKSLIWFVITFSFLQFFTDIKPITILKRFKMLNNKHE